MVFYLALTQTIKEQERCLTKQLESGEKEKKDVIAASHLTLSKSNPPETWSRN